MHSADDKIAAKAVAASIAIHTMPTSCPSRRYDRILSVKHCALPLEISCAIITSLNDIANEEIKPAITDGVIDGSVILKNVCMGDEPISAAQRDISTISPQKP